MDVVEDGFVYAMDARQVIPKNAYKINEDKVKKIKGERLYRSVMSMRHAYVRYAVDLSFWEKPKEGHNSFILPVRPDNIPGRIGQQSSCFTLHMHKAGKMENPTLSSIKVVATAKESILAELRQLNINQFTTYYDLDRLSREMKFSFDVERPQRTFWDIAGCLIKRNAAPADALNTLKSIGSSDFAEKIQQTIKWLQALESAGKLDAPA
jgi:hypothetical protein